MMKLERFGSFGIFNKKTMFVIQYQPTKSKTSQSCLIEIVAHFVLIQINIFLVLTIHNNLCIMRVCKTLPIILFRLVEAIFMLVYLLLQRNPNKFCTVILLYFPDNVFLSKIFQVYDFQNIPFRLIRNIYLFIHQLEHISN